MAPLCSPVTPLALWRRRDSTNSAPVARVSVCLPDGEQVMRELRINYNMDEVRALLADEIQFDPDQVGLAGVCDKCEVTCVVIYTVPFCVICVYTFNV